MPKFATLSVCVETSYGQTSAFVFLRDNLRATGRLSLDPIQELPTSEDEPPKRNIITRSLTVRDGYLVVPLMDRASASSWGPGSERIPPRLRLFVTRLHEDASVVDD